MSVRGAADANIPVVLSGCLPADAGPDRPQLRAEGPIRVQPRVRDRGGEEL